MNYCEKRKQWFTVIRLGKTTKRKYLVQHTGKKYGGRKEGDLTTYHKRAKVCHGVSQWAMDSGY